MFTFVIPARNEEGSIATVIEQALAASGPHDRVVVVDSGSTDATAQVASAAGAHVLTGPVGKGAAMAAALADVNTEWVCFLDADLYSSQVNVPALLRETVACSDADHVLGDYEYSDPQTILSTTFTVYQPLVDVFFPEVADLGANALTGYRVVRRDALPGELPPHFGVEAFLNITLAVAGAKTQVCHLGVIESRFFYKGAQMPMEVGRTILDLAVARGRLPRADRGRWEAWLAEGAEIIATIGEGDRRSRALSRLFAAVRRPMPGQSRPGGRSGNIAEAVTHK